MLDDNPLLLTQAIMLIAGIFSLAWGSLMAPLRMARWIGVSFIGANALVLCGFLILLMQTDNDVSSWIKLGPVVAVLMALSLARVAMQGLMQLPVRWREYALVIPVLLLSGRLIAPALVMHFTFYLLAAWILLRCTVEISRSLVSEFGISASLTIVWPFALGGVLMLLRLVFQLALPEYFSDSPNRFNTSPPFLWIVLTLLLAINTSLIGMLITRLIRHIRDLAERDVLTAVWNRQAIEQRLNDARARFKRYGETFTLLIFDLDHFKAVNDKLGHDGGDAALKHAAAVIGHSLRQLDILGRFGGEEFLVLLPLTDAPGACRAAERMRALLAGSPLIWHGQPLSITASFGVASACGPEETIDALVQRADTALYRAKASGRNRVEVEHSPVDA